MNTITLSGNLTKSPEIRYTADSTPVMSFRLAVPNYRSKDGQADFVDCVIFGDRCNKLADFVSKGSPVTVTGRLSCRPWQDKKGVYHEGVSVIVNEIDVHHRAPKLEEAFEVA